MAVAVCLRQGPEHPILCGDGVGGAGAGRAVVPGEDHHRPAVVETGRQQEVVLPEILDYDGTSFITTPPPGFPVSNLFDYCYFICNPQFVCQVPENFAILLHF